MLSLVAIAGLLANTGKAQTTTTTTSTTTSDQGNQPVTLEKFTVTGSNIRMASDELAVPVQTFDAEAIAESGVEKRTPSISCARSPHRSLVSALKTQLSARLPHTGVRP